MKNNYLSTPLYTAVQNNSFDVVKILVQAGAKINILNKNPRSPLNYIREGEGSNSEEIVRYLLDNGADPNLGNGLTNFHTAKIIKMMIEAGADPNTGCKGNYDKITRVLEDLDRSEDKRNSIEEILSEDDEYMVPLDVIGVIGDMIATRKQNGPSYKEMLSTRKL